jgi:hypothetical protein
VEISLVQCNEADYFALPVLDIFVPVLGEDFNGEVTIRKQAPQGFYAFTGTPIIDAGASASLLEERVIFH